MSKRTVLLVAGALVATGTVAALAAAPHFRGGRAGLDRHEGWHGMRLVERLKEMDADKDGAVSLDEFLGRRGNGFARLDLNGDGVVDSTDMAARAKQNVDYRTRRFLKTFDADKDGKVTREEFTQRAKDRFATRNLGANGTEPGKDGEAKEPGGWRMTLDRMLGRTDRRFARLDKNSDGAIDAADLEARADRRLAFASRRLLKRFDADNDGKVTRDEFDRSARQRFAMLDLDDDGRITEADLPPRMRGRGLMK